jgi:hypothetical protein
LQWLTIIISRNPALFGAEQLEGYVPFFVPLRKCAGGVLPKVEDIPSLPFSADVIIGQESWVGRCFESGKAILLVDGVDEVSYEQRNEVRQWLSDLLVH